MTARLLSTAAAALVAVALSATALAGAAAKDPKTMVLQKADFPAGAGARLTAKHGASSAAGSGYYVTYRYKTGSKPRELSSFVTVTKSRSLAVAVFRESKNDTISTSSRIVLPKYGDEQLATFLGLDGGQLIVRKGNTVWLLKAEYLLDPGLTKAEAIAELKRYAPKQMRHVGNG
jgi:hypothetical protein